MIAQIDARWWYLLNGLLRRAMAAAAPGFGPPKIILTEHPKSGGTWVTQILAEYFAIPNPRNRLPPRRRCVVHGHFMEVSASNDIVVVWRDGRDVMVSYYYYALFEQPLTRDDWVRANRRRIGIASAGEVHDVERFLPRFIEDCFAAGPPRGMTWSSFADRWKDRSDTVETSYEAMIADTKREMRRLVGAVARPARRDGRGEPPGPLDEERLDAAIAKFSFRRLARREPGEEDAHDFLRKGIVGDWRNKFTREAREVFDHHAGSALIALGYERDRSWVEAPDA